MRKRTLICSMSRLSSANGSAGMPAMMGGLPDAACWASTGSGESTLAGRDACPAAGAAKHHEPGRTSICAQPQARKAIHDGCSAGGKHASHVTAHTRVLLVYISRSRLQIY